MGARSEFFLLKSEKKWACCLILVQKLLYNMRDVARKMWFLGLHGNKKMKKTLLNSENVAKFL